MRRFGDIVKKCLLDDESVQNLYARTRDATNETAAVLTNQRLWLLSTLAFRINGLGADDGKQYTKLQLARFQLLEEGDWPTS